MGESEVRFTEGFNTIDSIRYNRQMVYNVERSDVIETGKRYSEADSTMTFDATYNDAQYLFIQNHWGDHWAVSQDISLDYDEKPSEVFGHLMEVSRKAALLDRAGFTPETLDDSEVLWIRDDDVPLWPDR